LRHQAVTTQLPNVKTLKRETINCNWRNGLPTAQVVTEGESGETDWSDRFWLSLGFPE